MTLDEIRDEAWDIARETSTIDEDRLWSLKEMNRYINDAYKRLARETRCITDSITPAICLIDVTPVDYTTYLDGTVDHIWANDPNDWLYQKNVAPYLFPLDPRILCIEEVKFLRRPYTLQKVSWQKWAKNVWWEKTIGIPTEYATDLQNNSIALNYRDLETDKLKLVVKRMPLVDMVDDQDQPEFKSDYHNFILDGVLEQMFSKQDAEAFDGEKASSYGMKFRKNIDDVKFLEYRKDAKLSPNHSMGAFT